MQPTVIVESHPVHHSPFGLLSGGEPVTMTGRFLPTPEALGERIASLPVNCFIHPAGRPIHTSWLKVLRRPVESALRPAIRVANQAAVSLGLPGKQCLLNEVCSHRTAHAPANDAPRHKGHVQPAQPGGDVGEVRSQSCLGRSALKTQLTRSSGHGALPSLIVVRTTHPGTGGT